MISFAYKFQEKLLRICRFYRVWTTKLAN